MTVLLIAATLGMVLYGYFIMGRIDKFFSKRNVTEDAHEVNNSSVLLFASETDFSFLDASLSEKQIPYITINEPDIPDKQEIMMVLAISDNDLDNLLLCCRARHRYPNVFLTAKCSDMLYLGIFKETGIQRVLTGNLTADVIISTIREVLIT